MEAHELKLLTVDEVCDRVRVGRTYLYSEVKCGALKMIKLGRLSRFRVGDVENWIKRRALEEVSERQL